jgi:hypothetical protein
LEERDRGQRGLVASEEKVAELGRVVETQANKIAELEPQAEAHRV